MAAERQVAVVTGAAKGIGAAVAERFRRDGCWVVLGYDVASSTAPMTEDENYRLEHCDVASEEQVAAAVDSIGESFGRVDVLVNVAGIVVVKPITEVTWEDFEQVVRVNLGGAFLWCKHTIPLMKERGGVVVNVASVSGHVGQVDHAIYGATKGAILSLTRALAWELAPFNIRVVSVSPGSVDTEMLRSDIRSESSRLGRSFEDLRVEREAEQALRRWASPEEIADPVFFLASGGASFITGADLLIDGGWTAR